MKELSEFLSRNNAMALGRSTAFEGAGFRCWAEEREYSNAWSRDVITGPRSAEVRKEMMFAAPTRPPSRTHVSRPPSRNGVSSLLGTHFSPFASTTRGDWAIASTFLGMNNHNVPLRAREDKLEHTMTCATPQRGAILPLSFFPLPPEVFKSESSSRASSASTGFNRERRKAVVNEKVDSALQRRFGGGLESQDSFRVAMESLVSAIDQPESLAHEKLSLAKGSAKERLVRIDRRRSRADSVSSSGS